MTNTTNQLSGLELRKQVAMKLGWRAIYGEGYGWSLIDPDGDIPVLSREPTEELAWQSCPAFESDLGALQASGILDAIFQHNTLTQIQVIAIGPEPPRAIVEKVVSEVHHAVLSTGQDEGLGSRALATALCRCFLSLPAETNA